MQFWEGLYSHLNSLHASVEGVMAHLEEDYPQAVEVHLLVVRGVSLGTRKNVLFDLQGCTMFRRTWNYVQRGLMDF